MKLLVPENPRSGSTVFGWERSCKAAASGYHPAGGPFGSAAAGIGFRRIAAEDTRAPRLAVVEAVPGDEAAAAEGVRAGIPDWVEEKGPLVPWPTGRPNEEPR